VETDQICTDPRNLFIDPYFDGAMGTGSVDYQAIVAGGISSTTNYFILSGAGVYTGCPDFRGTQNPFTGTPVR
jgi:hypothetical protein